MATLHNGSALEGVDVEYIVDIDLSSFGLGWDEFLRDSKTCVAKTRSWKTAPTITIRETFKPAARTAALFSVRFFYQRFEDQARGNLARYFEYLDDN